MVPQSLDHARAPLADARASLSPELASTLFVGACVRVTAFPLSFEPLLNKGLRVHSTLLEICYPSSIGIMEGTSGCVSHALAIVMSCAHAIGQVRSLRVCRGTHCLGRKGERQGRQARGSLFSPPAPSHRSLYFIPVFPVVLSSVHPIRIKIKMFKVGFLLGTISSAFQLQNVHHSVRCASFRRNHSSCPTRPSVRKGQNEGFFMGTVGDSHQHFDLCYKSIAGVL